MISFKSRLLYISHLSFPRKILFITIIVFKHITDEIIVFPVQTNNRRSYLFLQSNKPLRRRKIESYFLLLVFAILRRLKTRNALRSLTKKTVP